MQAQDRGEAQTRSLVDATVQVELPPDVVAMLHVESGGSIAERLTLLLADQRSRWRSGCPLAAERYLEGLPEIAADSASRLALVEGEIRSRREVGEMPTLAEFRGRFPDLGHELTVIFDPEGDRPRPGPGHSAGSDDPTELYGLAAREGDGAERAIHEFIGRYQVLRIIGKGGFGLVYLARDELLGRSVAIKVPRLDRVVRDEEVDSFLREAQILAGLDHEHIVPVYDVGRTQDGLCFVVSKWIDGESLTRAALGEPVDRYRVAHVVAAVAEALAHAHQKGLVHRDVKPSNILIDGAGKPYLADFGLALREEDFIHATAVAGTPAYMSPEQVRGEWHRVDARTDIFSLGIVLYELLSGSHPFGTGVSSTIMRRIALEEPIPPRQADGAIPRELERICLRALAPRASDRYATARELADELRLFVEEARGSEPVMGFGGDRGGEAPVGVPPTVVPRGLRAFGPEDAGFFLELLHGARDRAGLPESVRFWKGRIESPESFPVGLIYGPSGCGKSSIVRAGLLPRLSPRVVAIDEVATDNLEERLLARVRRARPEIGEAATLAEALAEVRRGSVLPRGSRVLIVLDQFEQWLHGGGGGPEDGLVRALRQCDGDRLQALIIVRVDFWMAAGRFMRELEVPVVEGRNASAVDLFPPAHARKVLTAWGVAYGTVPAPPAVPDEEQQSFIDRAVAMMTREGTVSPVRLALFAEMARNRPWTAETLARLGGAVGIGVRYLDETFVEPSAEHRMHREAAGRVLAALLPGAGADIKGQARSHRELLDASGYRDSPESFEAMIRILVVETRLITPMAPAEGSDQATAGPAADVRAYQLTHDYLVPSIREWLARHRRETPRGRAELMLAERVSLWEAKKERKQLPTLLEWASIRARTDSRRWTEAQRSMMRAADRGQLARAGRWAMLGAFLVAAGLLIRHRIDEDRSRARADALVSRLLDASSSQVRGIVDQLDGYRRWADPALRRAVLDPGTRPLPRLHARIALLPVDPGQADALFGAMLEANPDVFVMIRDAMGAYGVDRLWPIAESPRMAPEQAFRAAVALARWDAGNARWAGLSGPVVRRLLAQPSLLVPAWVELLRPVRSRLVPALAGVLRDRKEDSPLVASILADYAVDRPDALAEAIGDAGTGEFVVLMGSNWKDAIGAPAALDAALSRLLEDYRARPRDEGAARIANTAIALLRIGRCDRVWPLLRTGPDPAFREYLIDRMGPLHVDPAMLIERLRCEAEPSARAALLLAIGRFANDQIDEAARSRLTPEWLSVYRTDPDPGVHSSAGWLLRSWGRGDPVLAADREASTGSVPKDRRWYVNSQGQTMVSLPGRDDFQMGSPDDEPWRRNNEGRRIVRVRPFDIGATEVTIGEFDAFLGARPELRGRVAAPESSDPRLPRANVKWYDAVAYCNWVSEREGLPSDEWCYEPNEDGGYADGMKIAADLESRSGYRLPLEAEWEYACRAGTTTSRSFGDSDELLTRYACCLVNSSDRAMPVGSLLPNAYGLFDMHGNVFERCHDPYDGESDPETDSGGIVKDTRNRLVRGGGFLTHPTHMRSARRYMDAAIFRDPAGGFRMVRSRPDRDPSGR